MKSALSMFFCMVCLSALVGMYCLLCIDKGEFVDIPWTVLGLGIFLGTGGDIRGTIEAIGSLRGGGKLPGKV